MKHVFIVDIKSCLRPRGAISAYTLGRYFFSFFLVRASWCLSYAGSNMWPCLLIWVFWPFTPGMVNGWLPGRSENPAEHGPIGVGCPSLIGMVESPVHVFLARLRPHDIALRPSTRPAGHLTHYCPCLIGQRTLWSPHYLTHSYR